jgi:hypothetical protein
LSFRKKTNNLTGRESFGSGLDSGTGVAGIDWNAAHSSQQRTQQWLVIKFLVDDVTDGAGTSQLENNGVDPADVIGKEQTAAGRQVIRAVRRYAVEAAGNRGAKKVKQSLGNRCGGHRL